MIRLARLHLMIALMPQLPLMSAPADSGPDVRSRLSLDAGWRFHAGDVPMPKIIGHRDTYHNAKAGQAWGAASPGFDDSDWRRLDLPHDWVVEGPFDKNANISQGYRPRGIGWYRRYIRLDPADKGKHLEIQFDGIATHATVWVNGNLVHRNFCGYTSFAIDISPVATFGDQINTIAIRVDADAQEGWWYEGGGIYRHTWLVKRDPLHIETDGVFANPVRDDKGKWSVPVETDVANFHGSPQAVDVISELLDPDGRVLVSASESLSVPAMGSAVARTSLPVSDTPRLWSPESPTLYTLRCTLKQDGLSRDGTSVQCGFRTIRFDPDRGLILNDRPVRIQGTCNHKDHAGVGVAVPDALWDFRIRRLKEMGSNAYRCAHNPPAAEFLDACDRLGLLVMDENRHFNYTPEYLGQLRWLVRRDRNHPSVILWSVFNEEPMQGTDQGREMVKRMVAAVRKLDPSRPVTAAMNGGMMNEQGVFEAVDVMGFNYCSPQYDAFHAKHPALPLTSSEDTSAFMTRGEWKTDRTRNVISSLDEEHASWGHTHRKAWELIAERPYLAGGFVWTGFDYRGEPQPLAWPSVSSVFGIMDVCGFPKAAYFIHQAEWITDRPVLSLAPHWNWKPGELVRVIAMTNAERVALFLNDQPLGEKDRKPYDYLEWQVPFQPGKLEAVAFKGGREVARTSVETAGEPAALRLVPDRDGLLGDGRDAMPVTVQTVDAEGRAVPTANNEITFSVSGPGENIGHGNGDHNCHDPEKGPVRRLFNGLAQLIVQSKPGGAGPLTITASSPGLANATVTLQVRPSAGGLHVMPAEPIFALNSWRMAPPAGARPDPGQKMSDADMNTWSSIRPGAGQKVPSGQWVLYRARFQPWKRMKADGGTVVLKDVAGSAEVFLDGALVFTKSATAPATIEFPLPPASGEREVTLLVRSEGDLPVGLLGAATISSKNIHDQ